MKIMDTITSVVVVVVVIGIAYYLLRNLPNPSSSITVHNPIQDGRKEINSKMAIPKSVNQKEGLTFSYTCWVKIDDFAYRYGSQRVVFTKGPTDLSSMCPALLVDGNTNSLLVKLDTYGATEVIVNNFKTAYTKVKGSDAGFDAMLDDLKNSARKGVKEQLLKELVNKPAPKFELKGGQNNPENRRKILSR